MGGGGAGLGRGCGESIWIAGYVAVTIYERKHNRWQGVSGCCIPGGAQGYKLPIQRKVGFIL